MEVNDSKEKREVGISSRLSTTKSVTSAVTALVICVGLFLWLGSLGLNIVRQVKTGHPYDYPNTTYEEAFSAFFSNPKWENASSGDLKIVRFSGECTYNGKPAKVVLDFQLNNDNTFRLYGGTINGATANIFQLAQLNDTPFQEYKK